MSETDATEDSTQEVSTETVKGVFGAAIVNSENKIDPMNDCHLIQIPTSQVYEGVETSSGTQYIPLSQLIEYLCVYAKNGFYKDSGDNPYNYLS